MQGLYIHIPFCSRKCAYCAFYSTNNKELRSNYIDSILKEAYFRLNQEQSKPKIQSIYIGGGSPSILDIKQYEKLFKGLEKLYNLNNIKEITFEANPEHIAQTSYLNDLKEYTPINRLSIGVQSFFDDDLKHINRKHNAKEAFQCIEAAQNIGFNNISVDLIYALIGSSSIKWKQNLNFIKELKIQHLSAYALTIEEGTILHKQIEKGIIKTIDEDILIEQHNILMDFAKNNNFIAYETSNFAKEEFIALHNSNYWNNTPYIGLGAGAHSYSGSKRRWNKNDVNLYVNSLEKEKGHISTSYFEEEVLSEKDIYHEYIMTTLRTIWGIDPNKINEFSKDIQNEFSKQLSLYLKNGDIIEKNGNYTLSSNAILRTDAIAASFF